MVEELNDTTKKADIEDPSATVEREEEEGIALPPYFISYSRKRRCKTIHLTEGCWRTPGRHIHDYEYVYELEDLLESSTFCKDCKLKRDGRASSSTAPQGNEGPRKEDLHNLSASSSSSSTDSYDSSEERKKLAEAKSKKEVLKAKSKKRLKVQMKIK